MNEIDISTITEEEASKLTQRFFDRFGWVGNFITRSQVEREWQDQMETTDDISDDAWDTIAARYMMLEDSDHALTQAVEETIEEEGWA